MPDKNLPIKSYVKGNIWIEKLMSANDSWYKYNHLGVTLYTSGDVDGAYKAFLKSVDMCPNAWAYRNLAQIEKNEYNNPQKSVEYMKNAIDEKNDYQPLWVNYAECLFAVNDYETWVCCYENEMPDNIKENGRVLMLYALALVKINRYRMALDILTDDFVMPDIKEGEFSISHIWLEIHRKIMLEEGELNPSDSDVFKKYPLPYELDFRMH